MDKQHSVWVSLIPSGTRPDIWVLTHPSLSSLYPWSHLTSSEMTSQLLSTFMLADVFANYLPEFLWASQGQAQAEGSALSVEPTQGLYQPIYNSFFSHKCFVEIYF